MTYNGGDEIGALVFEFGTANARAGFAGEDTPKAVFPSYVGRVAPADTQVVGENAMDTGDEAAKETAEAHGNRYYVGSAALAFKRDHMDVLSPFKDGLIDDWDLFEQLVEHAYKSRLVAESKDHPALFGEPSFTTNAMREKLTELMFEKYQTPALFVAKNSVLSCFACGKSSALVLDCGAHGTVATAVYDGYALRKSITRSSVGGDVLTDYLNTIIESKQITIRPTYSFTKRVNGDTFEVSTNEAPNLTSSYQRFHHRELVRDVKDALCRVSDSAFDETVLSSVPTVSYELPDGQTVELGPERFRVAEALFAPQILKGQWDEKQSLPHLVSASVNNCDADIRKEMYHNLIVTGGGSLFGNLPERLAHEIAQLVTTFKVKTFAPPVPAERRFGAWIGGSILASLGSFHQMWMSKKEYQEYGKTLVEKKCP